MFLEEAFIDVAGFQNQRARALFIGFGTEIDPDIWAGRCTTTRSSTRSTNCRSPPLRVATSPAAVAPASAPACSRSSTTATSSRPPVRSSHRAHTSTPIPGSAPSVCPGGNTAENEFGILSPVPHEIQFRTGKKVADGAGTLRSIDITGAESTNGQYLFPFGANLGGINFPEALEFNLDLANQPFAFEGIPWDLDRRLSPGGCQAIDPTTHVATCESTPQPLTPFPWSELDPRNLAGGAIVAGGDVPAGPYTDPAFTSATLSTAANRILSFIPNAAATRFAGDASVLALPTQGPAARASRPHRSSPRADPHCWASTRRRARSRRPCTSAASASEPPPWSP